MNSDQRLNDPTKAMADGVCTHILVSLRLRKEVQPGEAMAMMHDEMVATAHLYLDGKIEQWFSQLDDRGVVFLFAGRDLEGTRDLMAALPLVRAGLVDLTFTRLGPLQPLRTLLKPAGSK